MDQETMKAEHGLSLGRCESLCHLDIAGCPFIDDNFVINLTKHEIKREDLPTLKPGLKYLETVKLNQTNISDFGLNNVGKVAPHITHLEITRCE